MNKKMSIIKFQILSILFVSILGTLLHFIFNWSEQNQILGALSAVNESTWEHLKLIFYPMLLMTIIGISYFRNRYPIFLCAKTIGILISLLFTITFFYTYTGILGFNIDILNIVSFFIAIILGEYVTYKIINSNYSCNNKISIIILLILLISFILFTYITPKISLFKDPLTSTFGI